MPGITNPAEEYFKDGLWGWVSTAWEKLVSSGGRLFTALHGWDGSAWRKLPLIWGYSDRWAENLGGTKSGDGNYIANTVAVPAGYVYVLQLVSLRNDAGVRGAIDLMISDGTATYYVVAVAAPVQYEPVVLRGPLVLKQGDYVQVAQYACLDGDVLNAVAWGYKMKIAE